MNTTRALITSVFGLSVLAACSAPGASEAEIAARVDAAIQQTIDAMDTAAPPTATQPAALLPPNASDTVAPTDTAASAPTSAPTSATTEPPSAPVVSVSLTTNCRTGPGEAYPFVLYFEPGQSARVIGRSSVDNYWYIAHPAAADGHCWLWGQYATVQGNAGNLPVLTPPPPPAPVFDFTLYRHSFSECGETRVSLVVVNKSTSTFRSGRIHVEDLDNGDDLHGPRLDEHPFADNPTSCPRDQGSNSLPPGATAYLVIPLSEFEGGHNAVANIRLCTDDEGGGECLLKSAFFQLPEG